MTVFALIPVFNRLHHTQGVIEAIRSQTIASEISIVVINDGSTDGTADYLEAQSDIIHLRGDGGNWWGGSIELGLQHILPKVKEGDYVLFLNNDTLFDARYVATLIEVSRSNADAAVGSAIVEESDPTRLTSIGARINVRRQAVWDALNELTVVERETPKPTYRVDALSGRGTLYPAGLFLRFGTMRPRTLPHYFADYEIAMRFARDGAVPLLVSTAARVISPAVYGNDVSGMTPWERMFSVRSSSNVIHRLTFFMLVGGTTERIAAPFQMAKLALGRGFIKLITKDAR